MQKLNLNTVETIPVCAICKNYFETNYTIYIQGLGKICDVCIMRKKKK